MKFLLPNILSDNNISQKELADAIGVPKQNISYICNEAKSINFNLLEGICGVLNCTPNDLFEIERKSDYSVLIDISSKNKKDSHFEFDNLENWEKFLSEFIPSSENDAENQHNLSLQDIHINTNDENSSLQEKYIKFFLNPYIRHVANQVFDERKKDDTE